MLTCENPAQLSNESLISDNHPEFAFSGLVGSWNVHNFRKASSHAKLIKRRAKLLASRRDQKPDLIAHFVQNWTIFAAIKFYVGTPLSHLHSLVNDGVASPWHVASTSSEPKISGRRFISNCQWFKRRLTGDAFAMRRRRHGGMQGIFIRVVFLLQDHSGTYLASPLKSWVTSM